MTPTMETVLIAAGLAILTASWWCCRQTRWTRKLRLSGAHGTVYVLQDRTLTLGLVTAPLPATLPGLELLEPPPPRAPLR